MTGSDDMMAGLPPSDEFEAKIAAKLAASGVSMTPGQPTANPDRTRAQHEDIEKVTGANKPGLMQNLPGPAPAYKPGGTLPNGVRPPPAWTRQGSAPAPLFDASAYGPALTWFHHLSRAQRADAEVQVYVRHNTAPYRGTILPEPKLSELDQDAATRLRTITLSLKSGGAPPRHVTIDLGEIVALTEQLPAATITTTKE